MDAASGTDSGIPGRRSARVVEGAAYRCGLRRACGAAVPPSPL